MTTKNWRSHFDFSFIDKSRTNGLCRLCHRNYKDKNGTYSNFLKHLKRAHPLEYNRTFNHEDEYTIDDINTSNGDNSTYDFTDMKHRDNRIILSFTKNLIIRCNIPFNLVEKPAFRDFMRECNFKFQPISSKKLKRDIIPTLSNMILKRVHDALKNIDSVTLTVDIWSDRRCRSFLGITCHFIDEKMIPRAYLIDLARFKSPHNNEAIYQLTEETLERFNIKNKVFKITTDNASSMIKAYRFGLGDDLEYSETQYNSENIFYTQSTGNELDDDMDLNNITMDNRIDGNDDYASSYQSKTFSSVRISCFAHTIQLCVRDGLKNEPQIVRVLEKCRRFAKFSDESTKIADILDELHKHITKMNVTRWNSEYLLVKSILNIEKRDLETISKSMESPIIFLNNDLKILQELVDILDPFFEISVKCQSDSIVTASLVVPAIAHLVVQLRDMKGNISTLTKLVEELQSSVQKRFTGIIHRFNFEHVETEEPFSDPVYFMAAVLDPSFKFYWMHDLRLPVNNENRLKQNIIQLILDDITNDPMMKLESDKEKTNTASSSFPLQNKTKKKLFMYNSSTDESNYSCRLNPAAELDSYLNDPLRSPFSDYWMASRLTILKRFVRRIFSVQASSAPIERVFSHAGLIMSARRTNMSEETFKNLVFLKVNQNLL